MLKPGITVSTLECQTFKSGRRYNKFRMDRYLSFTVDHARRLCFCSLSWYFTQNTVSRTSIMVREYSLRSWAKPTADYYSEIQSQVFSMPGRNSNHWTLAMGHVKHNYNPQTFCRLTSFAFTMAAESLHSPHLNNKAGFSWKDTVSLQMRIKFQTSGGEME